jgi:tRNA(fMet)-specific endonuclease VapC
VIRYSLDTNIVVALVNRSASPLGERIRSLPIEEIAISAIVMHELYFGAFASARRTKNLAAVDTFRFQVVPFDAADSRQAGEIRAALKAAGTPIGSYDVLIAGQAVAKGLTLVSNNLREFRRVPGLRVEDWLQT